MSLEESTTGIAEDPAALKVKAELAKKAEEQNPPGNGGGGDAANGHDANGEPAKPAAESEEPVAGPSSVDSPSKKDIQVVNQAMQYLAAGKRDLLIQDPNSAVASLARCCQLLGEHYGEMAVECGEAYYYYGRALLDLARMEAGVIDNVLDGVPSEDEKSIENSLVEDPEDCTDDEKKKVSEDVDEALKENYEELEKLKKEKLKECDESVNGGGGDAKPSTEGCVEEKPEESENSTEDDEENDNEENDGEANDGKEEAANGEEAMGDSAEEENSGKGEEKEKEDESIASDDNATTEAKDTGDAAAVEKEEEEDPSNLQLAWEMLELGKSILIKQVESLSPTTDKEREHKFNIEARISDTFQSLGELSIENENYPQAIDDLETCLKRRQNAMQEDSRIVAETYYQLGVAQGFNVQFDAATISLNSAIDVLQKRIDNLKEGKESVDPAKKNDAFYTREGEIKEIEGLIPEIHEKIADTKDMKEETLKKLGDRRLMEEEICSSSTAAKEGTSNGNAASPKVSSISSSLIKKRKKSGGGDAEGTEPKKPHIEEEQATTSATNGHHDKPPKPENGN